MRVDFKKYAISIAVTLAVGGLSAALTAGNMDLYDKIVMPPLSPPSVLFPIVWTVLYVLMGISAAAVNGGKHSDNSTVIYALQLAVNFLWSIIFFNFRAYLFAFLWLVLLWILIFAMIKSFKKVKPWAGLLQIPYLAWVTFAGYLNFMIYLLNG